MKSRLVIRAGWIAIRYMLEAIQPFNRSADMTLTLPDILAHGILPPLNVIKGCEVVSRRLCDGIIETMYVLLL